MNIGLVQPPLLDISGNKITGQVEVEVPLGIASLAAVLEQDDHSCVVVDAILEGYDQIFDHKGCQAFGLTYSQTAERLRKQAVELVLISCIFFYQRSSALALAEEIKRQMPELPVVMGGVGAFIEPEELLQSGAVDWIVIGEGEQTVRELAGCLAQGQGQSIDDLDGICFLRGDKVVTQPKTCYVEDLDSLPTPAYHLFDLERYFSIGVPFGNKSRDRYLNVLSSRGCPFDCIFCAAKNIWSRRIRYRSAETVLAEIRHLVERYNIEEVHFSDENLTMDRQRAIAILKGLKELGIRWTAPNGLMVGTLDEELTAALAESGCYSVSLAIESGSPRVLREVIRKPLQMPKVFSAVRSLKKHGIHCRGFFMIGLPGETRREIWQTVLLSNHLRMEQNEIMVALPYPGTDLFERCRETMSFSPDFALAHLNNDGGPITTREFDPRFLNLVKDVDRVLFYHRSGRKSPVGLLRWAWQRYRWRSPAFWARVLWFRLQLFVADCRKDAFFHV